MCTYAKRPRVSAAMKWMSFWCVQSLISNCFSREISQSTTTWGDMVVRGTENAWELMHLKSVNKINRNWLPSLTSKVSYWDICVEFRKARESGCSSRFPYIIFAEKKLKKSCKLLNRERPIGLITCDDRSCKVTGSGSYIVTDLTPARTMFFAENWG